MKREELKKKIYSKIDEIPTLPAVVPRLLDLMESDKSDANDIVEAISNDPALTSKILKVANSAYYGFSQEISRLDKAVPLLGFNMIKSLALSIGVFRSLGSKGKPSHFSMEGLWTHSLAVATVMRELGKRVKKGGDDGCLSIIGLLHDIGKIILDQFFGDLFEEVLEEAEGLENHKLYIAERKVLGFDHGEIGAMLLTRWKFPVSISDPIALHHQKDIRDGISAYDTAMLRIADVLPLQSNQEANQDEEGLFSIPDLPQMDLKFLGIGENDLKDIQNTLSATKGGINDFFTAVS